jgi:hypothetical protein
MPLNIGWGEIALTVAAGILIGLNRSEHAMWQACAPRSWSNHRTSNNRFSAPSIVLVLELVLDFYQFWIGRLGILVTPINLP